MNDSAKRMLLVSLDNVNRTPYLSRYMNVLDGRDCDFFYWNRSSQDHPVDYFSQVYALDCPVNPNAPRAVAQAQKLKGYLRFRQGFRKLIRRNAYSGIIFLHSPASVLTYQLWSKAFDRRVLVDVRDYTYEGNPVFRHLETEAIERALTVVISSPGYRNFLPEHAYYLMHNASDYGSERNGELREACNSVSVSAAPIRIACIGSAKNPAIDRKVIDLFGDDPRFSLLYAGRGFGCLEPHCKERGFSNVEVHDEFSSEKTFDFYKGVDIVMNLYGNGSPLWDYALSNKLYLAAQLGIPILVFRNTEMARVSEKYGFGIAIDLDESDVPDAVYDMYSRMNRGDVARNCDRFLESISLEDREADAAIARFAEHCLALS